MKSKRNNDERFLLSLKAEIARTKQNLVPLQRVLGDLRLPESTARGVIERLQTQGRIRRSKNGKEVVVGIHPRYSLAEKKEFKQKPSTAPTQNPSQADNIVVHDGKNRRLLSEIIGQVSSAHSALKAIRIILKLNLLSPKKRIETVLGIIDSTL